MLLKLSVVGATIFNMELSPIVTALGTVIKISRNLLLILAMTYKNVYVMFWLLYKYLFNTYLKVF